MILWAALSQSNMNGYVLAFFAALLAGIIFTKDEKSIWGSVGIRIEQTDVCRDRAGSDIGCNFR